jgi:hypothetical protein
MKPTLLIPVVLICSVSTLAQITNQPGYIISNDGQRTECAIRNMDWNSNPTSFQYKIGDGQPQEGTGDGTFRRFTVDIDRSSDVTSKLTGDRNPTFKKETLFLRIIANGKAVLYEYVDGGLKRYFYSMNADVPIQLVYKRYLVTTPTGNYQTGYSGVNEQFKQQIFMDLKCETISQKEVENLKYERGPLLKMFNKYNECTGTSLSTGEPEKRKAPMRLTLRPGLFYNGFYLSDGTTRRDFKKAAAFRFGVELEAVMPFNKGLWSVTFEPVYQTYSSKVTGTSYAIDYSAIDLSVSLRRYLFIQETRSLYVSVGFAYGFALSGEIKTGGNPLDISAGTNLQTGLGFKTGKLSVEFNYAFLRGLLGNYVNYTSGYGGPGLIVGYQIR